MSLVSAALRYGEMGLTILPLHDITKGHCSCSRREGCNSPGKHPRIKNGLNGASNDINTIRLWWSCWPNANIGILCGSPNNLVVLDLDLYKAPKLMEFIEKNNDLKMLHPFISKTGGGGLHIWYKHPGKKIKSNVDLIEGLDIRADGAYVVAPPSGHISKNKYEWNTNQEALTKERPSLPGWFWDLYNNKNNPKTDPNKLSGNSINKKWPNIFNAEISEGKRNMTSTLIIGYLLSKNINPHVAKEITHWWNREKCNPPMNIDEIDSVIENIAKKDFLQRKVRGLI